jgi:hypothetical protein
MQILCKYLSGIAFGIIAVLEPTLSFAAVLMFAILLDCWSAWDLARRLRKIYPDNVSGKFQSHHAMKIIKTFLQVYTVVVLLHLVDTVLLKGFGYLNLSNIGAAVFCGIQVWSILENLSSGNGSAWAKTLQRFMVDKAKRHFQINIDGDIWGLLDNKDDKDNRDNGDNKGNRNNGLAMPVVLTAVLFSSCCAGKPAITEKETVTVTMKETVRDTTVVIRSDTSMIRALLDCDENRNVVIRQMTELRSGLHVKPPRLLVRNNVLTVTAQVDSFAVYVAWKEREKQVREVQTEILTENKLTGWQWFQIWFGRIAALATLIILIIKKLF